VALPQTRLDRFELKAGDLLIRRMYAHPKRARMGVVKEVFGRDKVSMISDKGIEIVNIGEMGKYLNWEMMGVRRKEEENWGEEVKQIKQKTKRNYAMTLQKISPRLSVMKAEEDPIPPIIISQLFPGVYRRNGIEIATVNLFIGSGIKALQKFKEYPVKDNEIIILLELNNRKNLVSNNVSLIKVGKNAKEAAQEMIQEPLSNDNIWKFFKEKYPSFDQTQKEILLQNLVAGQEKYGDVVSMLSSFYYSMLDGVAQFGVNILAQIIKWIDENCRASEKMWNSANPEYVAKNAAMEISKYLKGQKNNLLNYVQAHSTPLPSWLNQVFSSFFRIADAVIDKLILEAKGTWAFICGFWNGLMDLVTGLLDIIKLFIQAMQASSEFNQNKDYYYALLAEYTDAFLYFLMDLDWANVIKKSFLVSYNYVLPVLMPTAFPMRTLELSKEAWEAGKSLFKNQISVLNNDEVDYYAGYILYNILEFLLPPLKASKLSRITKVETLMDNLLALARKDKKSSDVVQSFFDKMEEVIKRLEANPNEIEKVMDEFGKLLGDDAKKVLGDIKDPTEIRRILIAIQTRYNKVYKARKMGLLWTADMAKQKHGQVGYNVVEAVTKIATEKKAAYSKADLMDKFVMFSGMVYRDENIISKVFTASNFTREEIGKLNRLKGIYESVENGRPVASVFQKFIDDLHPVLKNRLNIHRAKQEANGLKVSLIDSEDIRAVGNTFDIAPLGKNIERGEHARAGAAGSHGEIRALDDLFKHLEQDKKMTVTDNTLEKILAYNYNLSSFLGISWLVRLSVG
jgi:hypothetical protein